MAEMAYRWIDGEINIIATTIHEDVETTEPFRITDLKDIIKEMKTLETVEKNSSCWGKHGVCEHCDRCVSEAHCKQRTAQKEEER